MLRDSVGLRNEAPPVRIGLTQRLARPRDEAYEALLERNAQDVRDESSRAAAVWQAGHAPMNGAASVHRRCMAGELGTANWGREACEGDASDR